MADSAPSFVAIDFETASSNPNSACQLAAVRVQDGQLTDQWCWMLRPPRLYFAPRNIQVHGIRAADVRESPTIEEIWPELHAILDGEVIIAHNASFDMRVLMCSLAAFDIACPVLEYSCTRVLARAAWPGRRRYGLKALADSLDIRFKHHDALEDARCCATIALHIARGVQARDMEHLERQLRVTRGLLSHGTMAGPRRLGASHSKREFVADRATDARGMPTGRRKVPAGAWSPAEVIAAAGDSSPLDGRRVCLLGPLTGLSLQESRDLIQQLGGSCVDGVDDRPDFVIVGCSFSMEGVAADGPSTPDRQTGIRVLSERQFRALLPGGKRVRGQGWS